MEEAQLPQVVVDLRPLRRILGRAEARLGILAFAAYALLTNHILSSGPDGLTLMTQAALFFHRTFAVIGPSWMYTNDVQDLVQVGRYWYGAQSYGLALLLMPLAIIGLAADGRYEAFGLASLLDRLAVAAISAAAVALAYRAMAYFTGRPRDSALAALALAFSTTLWPFSEVIYYHPLSALATVYYIYAAVRYLRGELGRGRLLAASIFLGLAAWIDYSLAAAALALGALTLILSRLSLHLDGGARREAAWSMLAIVAAPAAAQGAADYAAFGDPLFVPGLGKGSFSARGLLLHAAWYLVSTYRGLIVFDPIAYVALYYAARSARRYPAFAAYVLAPLVATLLFVSAWKYWDGGIGYGPRYLIAPVAALILALPLAGDLWSNVAFWAAFAAGFAVNALGSLQAILPAGPNNYLGFAPPFSTFQLRFELRLLAAGGEPLWGTIALGAFGHPAAAAMYVAAAWALALAGGLAIVRSLPVTS